MKVTLQEAYDRATKGPLEISAPRGFVIYGGFRGYPVAITQHDKLGPTDAALLAHAFNVLPKLLEAMRRVGDHIDLQQGLTIKRIFAKEFEILDKASTVEVPE
jgi:hypothetical protein